MKNTELELLLLKVIAEGLRITNRAKTALECAEYDEISEAERHLAEVRKEVIVLVNLLK